MIIPDVLILLASIKDTKKGIKLRGKNDSIAQLVKALAYVMQKVHSSKF